MCIVQSIDLARTTEKILDARVRVVLTRKDLVCMTLSRVIG